MPSLKALKYEKILQSLNDLSEKQQLQLIRDISTRLQKKLNAKSTPPVEQAKAKKTLADLRGILNGVRISEQEITATKYQPKSLPDF